LTDLTQGPLPQPISITFSAAACGAGKTFWATRFAASRVGLGNFVFALDRIDEFAVRRQMLLDAFAEIGRPPCRIEAIHAQNTSGVTQAIRDFPKECREPTILFITHAGLQVSDLSAYREWYLVIDEVPNCWFSDELKTPATWQWFADTYNLTQVSASWSQVTPKATAPTLARIQEDSLGNQIAVLAGRIRDTRSGVFASVADWADTAVDGPRAAGWQWFAVWSPECLRPFKRVWMLGNSIERSLTFNLWQGSVDWREFALSTTRRFRPRRVVIEWYSKRRASSRFFGQHPEVLDLVAAHINRTCDEADHFWSCNVGVAKNGFRLKGRHVGPRASGRNDLMSFSQGAFIYSAKPRPTEAQMFELMNISEDMVIRAREYEDLLQMFGRCSIRNPEDEREVIFRVFSWDQATIIAEHYAESPHAFELRHVDLDLPGQGGGEAGRPAVHGRTLTNKERAKAKYWRDKMAAADVNDVRDLPRAGKLTDEEVAMINASYQRAIAAE
jgi:hypothetical protein